MLYSMSTPKINGWKRIITIRSIVGVAVGYLCIELISEYLHWIQRLITVPYLLDIMNVVVYIVLCLMMFTNLLFVLTDRTISGKKKVLQVFCIIIVFVVTAYIPDIITRYFISAEIVLS